MGRKIEGVGWIKKRSQGGWDVREVQELDAAAIGTKAYGWAYARLCAKTAAPPLTGSYELAIKHHAGVDNNATLLPLIA